MILTSSSINSPEKIKLKPSPRKKIQGKKASRKGISTGRITFTHGKAFISTFEQTKGGETMVLSLKKIGPAFSATELSQLPSHFLTENAGIGIVVVFSITGNVACGRVPFCARKPPTTGFGVGLVWLSRTLNKLREIASMLPRTQARQFLNEDEVIQKVNKSENETFFRVLP